MLGSPLTLLPPPPRLSRLSGRTTGPAYRPTGWEAAPRRRRPPLTLHPLRAALPLHLLPQRLPVPRGPMRTGMSLAPKARRAVLTPRPLQRRPRRRLRLSRRPLLSRTRVQREWSPLLFRLVAQLRPHAPWAACSCARGTNPRQAPALPAPNFLLASLALPPPLLSRTSAPVTSPCRRTITARGVSTRRPPPPLHNTSPRPRVLSAHLYLLPHH